MGVTLNTTLQRKIEKEHHIFGDIIQESFIDTYANLTIKSLMLLKWFKNSCDDRYVYLLKTDDDVKINMKNKGVEATFQTRSILMMMMLLILMLLILLLLIMVLLDIDGMLMLVLLILISWTAWKPGRSW